MDALRKRIEDGMLANVPVAMSLSKESLPDTQVEGLET